MTVALIVSEKSGKVTFFLPLTLTFLTLTLGEGHRSTYILKRHITKYLCAKFDVCIFNSIREKWQCYFLVTFDLDLFYLDLG